MARSVNFDNDFDLDIDDMVLKFLNKRPMYLPFTDANNSIVLMPDYEFIQRRAIANGMQKAGPRVEHRKRRRLIGHPVPR